jgi:hypothetical protein
MRAKLYKQITKGEYNYSFAQESKGSEQEQPKWARKNRSTCCGETILYYGDDYKGFCPKCGRDL